MGSRITLREVAIAAGVSPSAVSLALAGSVRIAAVTAERIRAAAARLGYVKDLTQAGVASSHFRHSGKPALVAAWVTHRNTIAELVGHAATMGMTVRPVETDRAGLAEAVGRLGAAALVVDRRGESIAGLADLGLPVVSWKDEGGGEPTVDILETCEWWTASRQAIRRVQDAGYRRLAAVLIPACPRHWHDDVRLAAMRSLGLPVLEWDRQEATLARFIRRTRPEAVIGTGLPVFRALRSLGKPLPFAALHTFDTPWHRMCAGWMEDFRRRVQLTFELIEQRLRYGDRPACRLVIVPRWHQGSSLWPAGSSRPRAPWG